MTGITKADIGAAVDQGEAVAKVALPFLPPNAQLALIIAMQAIDAVRRASATGKDITDDELDALFVMDDKARADDLAAQKSLSL